MRRAREQESLSGFVLKVIGAGFTLAAGYLLLTEIPHMKRYIHIHRIAKSRRKGTAKGLPIEGAPTYAQAPKRAIEAYW